MSPTDDTSVGLRSGWSAIGRVSLRRLAIVTLVLLPVLGLGGVILADLVPDRLVVQQLFEDVERGAIDENYPMGTTGVMLDRFSECKRMTVGLGDPAGVGPIESAIRSPTLGGCGSSTERINDWAQGGGLEQAYEYSRYWNGSALVFRVGLVTVGVTGMRVLAAVALAGVVMLAWRGWSRLAGAAAASLMVAVIIGSTDFIDLPGALLHAVSWTVSLGVAALIATIPPGAPVRVAAWMLFVAGAASLYLGDMANPEAAWVLATGTAAMVAVGEVTGRPLASRTALGGAAWIAGFAYMWCTKWLFGVVVYGVDRVRADIGGQIEERLDGEHAGLELGVWGGLDRTWDAWWSFPLTSVVVPAAVVIALVLVVRRGWDDARRTWLDRCIVAAPALIPLVWYAVLRNHTQVHAWFVYRSLPAALAVVLAAWTMNLRPRTSTPRSAQEDDAALSRVR